MAKEAGIPTEEPPELADGFGGWYEDFWELSTERSIGMAIGPIPAHAIDVASAGMTYDDADMFRACMRAMDDVYMTKANGGEVGEASPEAARNAFRQATGRG